MKILTQSLINRCRKESLWDLGNKVLYDLCRKRPEHSDKSAVLAKIWLIGRSYAAAIERRRTKKVEDGDFYLNVVAPKICGSKIDTWIGKASIHRSPSARSIQDILTAHYNVTNLFSEISGLEKRSLASKYLHFHRPNLFYIYDTRAVSGMRELSDIVGRAEKSDDVFDREYRKFTNKCIRLRDHIKDRFNVSLTPRQIDTLLLEIHSHVV